FGQAVVAFWRFGAGNLRGNEGKGCGGSPGAEAHERKGARALPRACHGGGDVAVVQTAEAVWRGKEGSSAGGSGARGLWGCRVWQWSSRRWTPGLPEQWQCRSAPAIEEAEGERRRRKTTSWTCLQIQKSL